MTPGFKPFTIFESIRVIQNEQKRGNDILALYRLTVQGFVPVYTFLSRLYFFFSSLSYFYTVSPKRFSTPSLAKSRIIAKTFQNYEFLVAIRHDGNCCKDFFQFRHFQVVKHSFFLGFSAFLTGKKLLLNGFRGLHLRNPENLANIFKTSRHVEHQTKNSYFFPWRHPCVYGQPPITARVALTTLYCTTIPRRGGE